MLTSTPTHKYLLAMPNKVLFGTAAGIESWLKENGKQRPTLLDLEKARAERKRKR